MRGSKRVEMEPMPFFTRPIVRTITGRVQRSYIGPQIIRHLNYLEEEIGKSLWFAGNEFTAADIQMSFPLEAAAVRAGLDASRPKLMDFLQRIHGRPNLHLLFWLSLIPFVTGWMGENHFAETPVALYGAVLLMAGLAYYILSRMLIKHDGRESAIATALGSDFKGKISMVIYAAAIPLSFVNRWLAVGLYVIVAAMWFVPDRRIESLLDR